MCENYALKCSDSDDDGDGYGDAHFNRLRVESVPFTCPLSLNVFDLHFSTSLQLITFSISDIVSVVSPFRMQKATRFVGPSFRC